MSDQSTIERDFYGAAGAGPLTVTLGPDEGYVHLAIGDYGLYLEARSAFQLSHLLEQLATECRLREQGEH